MRGRCGSKKGKAGRALWSNNAHCPSTHLVAPLGPVYSNGDREAEEREGHTVEINHTACNYAEGASSRPSADALDEPHKKRGCMPTIFSSTNVQRFCTPLALQNGDGCGRPARGHDRTWGGPGRATQCTRCKLDPSFCTRAPVPAVSARVATPGLGRKHPQAAVFLVALPRSNTPSHCPPPPASSTTPSWTTTASVWQHAPVIARSRCLTCLVQSRCRLRSCPGAWRVCLPAHTITPVVFSGCLFF